MTRPFSAFGDARQVGPHRDSARFALLLPLPPRGTGSGPRRAAPWSSTSRLLPRLPAAACIDRSSSTQAIPAGMVLYPTSVLVLLADAAVATRHRRGSVGHPRRRRRHGDARRPPVRRPAHALESRQERRGQRWRWSSPAAPRGRSCAGGAARSIIPPPYLWFSIGAPIAAALVAAAVETIPIRLDDNLSVPFDAQRPCSGPPRSSARTRRRRCWRPLPVALLDRDCRQTPRSRPPAIARAPCP